MDSKEKFATEKNMKRNNFREAMEQIEAALNGEDSAPISVSISAHTGPSMLNYRIKTHK